MAAPGTTISATGTARRPVHARRIGAAARDRVRRAAITRVRARARPAMAQVPDPAHRDTVQVPAHARPVTVPARVRVVLPGTGRAPARGLPAAVVDTVRARPAAAVEATAVVMGAAMAAVAAATVVAAVGVRAVIADPRTGTRST